MTAEDIDASKAPLLDHLVELRSRLIKSLLGFGVAFIFCFFFAKPIYNILVWPFVWVAGPENSKFIYTQLLEYIVSADLIFYVLMVAAVILLRRKAPQAQRPYRMWGYPFVPMMSILLAGLLTVDLAWIAPATSGIGILIVLSGVPIYFLWRKSNAGEPSGDQRT